MDPEQYASQLKWMERWEKEDTDESPDPDYVYMLEELEYK